MLERLGWRYMPLWTIEVFTDPSSCADQIGRYLGLPTLLGDTELESLMGTSGEGDPSVTAVIDSPRSRRRNHHGGKSVDGTPAPDGKPRESQAEAGRAGDGQVRDAPVGDGQTGAGKSEAAAGDKMEGGQGAPTAAAVPSPHEAAESVTTVSQPSNHSSEDSTKTESAKDAGRVPVSQAQDAAILPKVAPHDDAHTWGDDRRDRGHDEWLRENKPPHWG